MASIRLLSKYSKLVDSVVGKKNAFETMAQLSIFAASLAFSRHGILKKKVNVKLIPENREIRDAVLDKYRDQIDMLAMAHTESHEILKDGDELKDQRYKILENYANHGLSILEELKSKNPTDESGIDTVVEELVNVIKKLQSEINETEEIEKPDF